MFFLMLCCTLIIPILLLILGPVLVFNPPKQVSETVGYRTKLACKNNDIWLFAQKYAGKIWTIFGIVLLVIALAGQLPFRKAEENTVLFAALAVIFVQTLCFLISNALIKKKLLQNFDENGNRLEK